MEFDSWPHGGVVCGIIIGILIPFGVMLFTLKLNTMLIKIH